MCSHVASWPYPSDHFDQNNDGAWCAKAIDSLLVVVKAFFLFAITCILYSLYADSLSFFKATKFA